MKPVVTLVICAAMGAALPVQAQPMRGGPPPGEGRGPGPGGALFISPAGEPFRAGPGEPYPSAAWFAGADRNQDGALDRDEFRADADRFFKTLDLNHDGELRDRELTRYETVVVPEILGLFRTGEAQARIVPAQYGGMPVDEGPSGHIPDHKSRGPVLEGAARFTPLGAAQPVTAADENFDHRITEVEFAHAADRRFKLLDRDGDGRFTFAELPMTVEQRQRQGGERRPRRRL